MKRSVIALILVFAMVFSLAGCTIDPAGTQPTGTTAPPETTAPPALSPQELYAQAREKVDSAQDLELSITYTEKRTVCGDTYSESITQDVSLQDLGTETTVVSLTEAITLGEYVYNSQEYYSDGVVKMMFDNEPFRSEMAQEDYLSRLIPAVLIDAALYEDIALQLGINGSVLVFSQPSAGEAWGVPEGAELVSAQGSASIDENGNLTKTTYTASFQYSAAQYDISVSTAITPAENLALTNPLPAAEDEYVTLSFIDAPYMLRRASADIYQSGNISTRTVDTMMTQAGQSVFTQQQNLDIYRTEDTTMSKYTGDTAVQGSEGISQRSVSETLRDGNLEVSYNDGDPTARALSESQVSRSIENYIVKLLTGIWTPDNLNGAELVDLGSLYMLKLTGNDALSEQFCLDTTKNFWNNENFLNDLSSSYDTTELEAYLSIDKYTQLPVAFGYSYKGIHFINGGLFALTNQRDQTIFLSSNSTYHAITDEPMPDVEPTEKATPLFYHVTGENGQEMWLFGTIHVGDDRTGFLPKEIFDALDNSDALAVEFDMDAFDERLDTDDKLISQVQAAYFYSDGSRTQEHLDEETYEAAVEMMKATGNYFANAEYLKVALWSQSIENTLMQYGYGPVSEKGVDNRLMDYARKNGIEIRDVESGLFQIQMMTGYSDELQALMLQDAISYDSAQYRLDIIDLYEKWCQGNEEILRAEVSNEVDTSEFTEEELAEYEADKHLYDEYNKAMSYDRNEGMLKTAIRYLESGETIFFAVGLAHLLDDVNGLVDALRAEGYTVELVTFAK